MRFLWMVLNILLFKLFADIVDRNHDLIRRMMLKLLSAVADTRGTEL